MFKRTKKYIFGALFLWVLMISASAIWNATQALNNQEQIYLEGGRAFFNQLVITWEWNSRHGGVYVPVTADTQPNLYLDVPNRDVTTTSGQKLTLINPAYMTRLISEVAAEKEQVLFHITSLKPIRPANAAEAWEAHALADFERIGKKEYYEFSNSAELPVFRYMAPLITQESCLKCHAKQGYKIGDVRGGISVTFPAHLTTPWVLILSHVLIGLVGVTVILFFGYKLDQNMQVLESLSNIDGLTQIHNRRYFDQTFLREFQYTRRNKTPLSVAICDIDHFKPFNDLYGHPAGDEGLKVVAQAFESLLKRPGDLVARYGGEEFGIVLPYTNLDGAMAICNTLCAKIESLQIPHKASAAAEYLTVSIGVASYAGDEISQEMFLKMADKALYQAKSHGRNMVMSSGKGADALEQSEPT